MCSRRWALGWVACAAVACLAFIASGAAQEAPPAAARRAVPASAEARIRAALAEKVVCEFIETPLSDVLDYFSDHLGIPIVIDRRALDEVAVDAATSVTMNVRDVSARSALELILWQIDLTWLVRHEVLMVTTPEWAERRLDVKVYDVTDLLLSPVAEAAEPAAPARGGMMHGTSADFDSLIYVITSCVRPIAWDEVGGPGSIAPFETGGACALVVSQTQVVHEELASLLADLRRVRNAHAKAVAQPPPAVPSPAGPPSIFDAYPDIFPAPNPGGEPPAAPAVPPPDLPAAPDPAARRVEPPAAPVEAWNSAAGRAAEARIRKALNAPLDISFAETPLSDALDSLKRQAGVQIVVDRRSLYDAGVDPAVPLTVQAKGVMLRSVLGLVLEPLGLAWTVDREVLLVTSADRAAHLHVTRVYDVAELLRRDDDARRAPPDLDDLIHLLVSTVEPTTWDDVGGPGSIEPYGAGGARAIVVNAPWRIQEKVAALLGQLREKAQGR
jgi:hypothetical protein